MRVIPSWLLLSVAMPLTASCSARDVTSRSSPVSGDSGTAGCAPDNATQACACGTSSGRRTCVDARWTNCECSAVVRGDSSVGDDGGDGPLEDDLGNGSTIRFDWERTVPTSGTCEPGRYVGQATCDFQAVGFPVGPLPVTLDFTLGKPASGGEILRITTGKLSSISAAGTVQMGDLVGELDCPSRQFTGHVENGTIFAYGATGKIEGTLLADYDKLTHQLVNGAFNGTGDIAGVPGGCQPGSTWSASFQP